MSCTREESQVLRAKATTPYTHLLVFIIKRRVALQQLIKLFIFMGSSAIAL
jgi:hypothetical protein